MKQMTESCVVIYSRREDGERFRPSDWIERLSSSAARFAADRRLRYDDALHPLLINGEKCLFVSTALQRRKPHLYAYILAFAAENRLQMEWDSCQQQPAWQDAA
jgi:hypothetical protein